MKSSKYNGMTVNERLVVSGKIEEFDIAVSLSDEKKVAEILKGLLVDDNSISDIIKSLKISHKDDFDKDSEE